jgi:anthranilate phosphoribosyltransferase
MHGEPDVPPNHGVTVAGVLDGLGVPVDQPAPTVERGIEDVGIAYLRQRHFAPDLVALKWLRQEIALRSPLNMVEKIYDPANAPYHLIGLTHMPYLEKLGDALVRAGFRKTALVQGMEGNEDLPTSRGVRVIELEGAEQREYRLNAADFGLEVATPEDVAPGVAANGGPSAERSIELTERVLHGEAPAPWRDLVAFNAGFRVHLTGRADDVTDGIARAREAIESGRAAQVLERWRASA